MSLVFLRSRPSNAGQVPPRERDSAHCSTPREQRGSSTGLKGAWVGTHCEVGSVRWCYGLGLGTGRTVGREGRAVDDVPRGRKGRDGPVLPSDEPPGSNAGPGSATSPASSRRCTTAGMATNSRLRSHSACVRGPGREGERGPGGRRVRARANGRRNARVVEPSSPPSMAPPGASTSRCVGARADNEQGLPGRTGPFPGPGAVAGVVDAERARPPTSARAAPFRARGGVGQDRQQIHGAHPRRP